jgi:hypothetical protein
MSHPNPNLIELRHQYESVIAQSKDQLAQASAQLEYIDALLVNGLLQGVTPTLKEGMEPDLLEIAAIQKPVPETMGSPATKTKAPASNASYTAAKSKANAPSSRKSLPLLPAYAGMTKLEAITQVLTEQSGHSLHQDSILQLLYGDLSPEQLSVESRRIRASLSQGVKKKLWQRAPKQPSCYVIKIKKGRQPKVAAENKITAPVAATPTDMIQPPSFLCELTYDPDALPIWELAARISAKVPDEEWAKVPPDLSQRFDYYQGLKDNS